ncbi:MAG: hypothetical protein WC516_05240 [Patescibacteria group bacterium]
MNCVWVCDLDSTIIDTTERIGVITKKYNLEIGLWTAEHMAEFARPEYIKNDKIIPGAEIITPLARVCGAKLMFLTGRSNLARDATRDWLRHNLNIFDSVPLIMREDGNLSAPTECKLNMFKQTILKAHPDGYFVFFDDDEKLLLEYSKYGLALLAPDCWKTIAFCKEDGK